MHRDLKPDNILIKENKIYISDFGIAYYNPELFEQTGHTTEGERLANFDFSAPEQRNSKMDPSATMDIYAIGQIAQWLVFGNTTKGTHRKNLFRKFETPRMHFLDSVVDKCLNDDPSERYQSIDEILNQIEKYNIGKIQKNNENEDKDLEMVPDSGQDIEEMKEALKDIINKICSTEYGEETEKNFIIFGEMDEMQIMSFLENIPNNLEKLKFFEKVGFSKFVGAYSCADNIQIKKEYFEILYGLYNKIKEKFSDLQSSFIEYIKTEINNNFELPF